MIKTSKLKNYRLICPHPALRYKCHYCGLSAPHFDLSPPVEVARRFDEEGIDYDPVKVPVCKECLRLSQDCKDWRLPDRNIGIKKMLAKKYKRHLTERSWQQSEIKELDYSLATLVIAHYEYRELIESRIAWGFESKEEAFKLLRINK